MKNALTLPPPSPWRDKLVWLHTWTGLTLGLVVVFLGVTGALFVLRPQLDGIVYADLFRTEPCGQRLPLDTFTRNALRVHPQGTLESLEFFADPRRSVGVKFSNDDFVYLDACSGVVLGQQNAYRGVFGTADRLHRFWFMDKETGKQIAGWSTAVWAVLLIIGGIVLWWPKSLRTVKGALKFNPRLPGSARTLSLHKVAGLYSSLILFGLAITALPVSFPPIKNALYAVTNYEKAPEPHSIPRRDAARLPLETVWQRAQARAPHWDWVSVQYPMRTTDAVEVQIVESSAPHRNAKSYVYVDAFSGTPLAVSHYASDIGIGRKIYLYSIALHAGLIWGLPYQLLLLIACLAIPVQAYSGFSPYLRRKFRARSASSPAVSALKVRVAARTLETADVCCLELVSAQAGAATLPSFTAGAHIEIRLAPGLNRQYSLCNQSTENHRYVIGVHRDPQSRGGSQRMHQLRVGDIVEIGAPRNLFPLAAGETSEQHTALLIGGGIGITPLLSMAAELAARHANFTLHYCVRARSHAPFLQWIERSPFAGRVVLHASDEGKRLDVGRLLRDCAARTPLYVCGPARLIDEVLATASALGWPDELVHREFFAAAPREFEANRAFDVRILRSGQLIPVPADRSIVDALTEHSIHVPTSCAAGVCGTCLTRVVDGDVEHRDQFLTARQRAANDVCTPCCSRARGGVLTLDL